MLFITKQKHLFVAMGLALGMVAAPALAQSGSYPERPIRLLVSSAPGGTTDISARMVADALGQRLNQSIVVENKPGGAGNIAAQQLL